MGRAQVGQPSSSGKTSLLGRVSTSHDQKKGRVEDLQAPGKENQVPVFWRLLSSLNSSYHPQSYGGLHQAALAHWRRATCN